MILDLKLIVDGIDPGRASESVIVLHFRPVIQAVVEDKTAGCHDLRGDEVIRLLTVRDVSDKLVRMGVKVGTLCRVLRLDGDAEAVLDSLVSLVERGADGILGVLFDVELVLGAGLHTDNKVFAVESEIGGNVFIRIVLRGTAARCYGTGGLSRFFTGITRAGSRTYCKCQREKYKE